MVWVARPSMVCAPLAARVVTFPGSILFIVYILPAIPNAEGSVTVVVFFTSIIWSSIPKVYALFVPTMVVANEPFNCIREFGAVVQIPTVTASPAVPPITIALLMETFALYPRVVVLLRPGIKADAL